MSVFGYVIVPKMEPNLPVLGRRASSGAWLLFASAALAHNSRGLGLKVHWTFAQQQEKRGEEDCEEVLNPRNALQAPKPRAVHLLRALGREKKGKTPESPLVPKNPRSFEAIKSRPRSRASSCTRPRGALGFRGYVPGFEGS